MKTVVLRGLTALAMSQSHGDFIAIRTNNTYISSGQVIDIGRDIS